MTPKERAAMQQALEYLKGTKTVFTEDEELDEAITALRSALTDSAASSSEALAEQAEQEPVAWWNGRTDDNWVVSKNTAVFLEQTPLYAAPVRTKDPCNPLQDLTDEEITAIACETYGDTSVPEVAQIRIEFARAVIAAYKEKNK